MPNYLDLPISIGPYNGYALLPGGRIDQPGRLRPANKGCGVRQEYDDHALAGGGPFGICGVSLSIVGNSRLSMLASVDTSALVSRSVAA